MTKLKIEDELDVYIRYLGSISHAREAVSEDGREIVVTHEEVVEACRNAVAGLGLTRDYGEWRDVVENDFDEWSHVVESDCAVN